MRISNDKSLSMFDQLLSSSTAPLYVFFSFLYLPINEFAICAQIIFLYGCLASIFQSVLAEPYLISSKFEIREVSVSSYYSAALIGAFTITFLSLPIVFLITGNFLISILLYLPIMGMLLQDAIRYLLIQKKRWHRLMFSDGTRVVVLIILIHFLRSEGMSVLLFAWGLSGICALLVILDYREFKKLSRASGYRLLSHNAKNYSFAFIETTFSGILLISYNWFIANLMGEEDISMYRLLALFYGISTVLINRQRVFDFAHEHPRELRAASIKKVYRRFQELLIIVAFNFIVIYILLNSITKFSVLEFTVSPSYFLLIVGGFENVCRSTYVNNCVFEVSRESKENRVDTYWNHFILDNYLCSFVDFWSLITNCSHAQFGNLPYSCDYFNV